jgi:hypothetical protein
LIVRTEDPCSRARRYDAAGLIGSIGFFRS